MRLVLVFLLIGCASNSKKKLDVSDKDFKPVVQQFYSEKLDQYNTEVASQDKLLGDETLMRVGYSEMMPEPIGNIVKKCHQKDFKEAKILISSNATIYRTNAIFWLNVGNCYVLQKQYSLGLLYYNRALGLKSNYAAAYNNIAYIYMKRGDRERAQIAYEKAIELDRYALTPKLNISKLYLNYGLAVKAYEYVQSLYKLGKSDNEVKTLYLVTNNYLGKENDNIKLCTESDLDSDTQKLNCAASFLKTGNKQKASEIISNLNIEPKHALYQSYKNIKREL